MPFNSQNYSVTRPHISVSDGPLSPSQVETIISTPAQFNGAKIFEPNGVILFNTTPVGAGFRDMSFEIGLRLEDGTILPLGETMTAAPGEFDDVQSRVMWFAGEEVGVRIRSSETGPEWESGYFRAPMAECIGLPKMDHRWVRVRSGSALNEIVPPTGPGNLRTSHFIAPIAYNFVNTSLTEAGSVEIFLERKDGTLLPSGTFGLAAGKATAIPGLFWMLKAGERLLAKQVSGAENSLYVMGDWFDIPDEG